MVEIFMIEKAMQKFLRLDMSPKDKEIAELVFYKAKIALAGERCKTDLKSDK